MAASRAEHLMRRFGTISEQLHNPNFKKPLTPEGTVGYNMENIEETEETPDNNTVTSILHSKENN